MNKHKVEIALIVFGIGLVWYLHERKLAFSGKKDPSAMIDTIDKMLGLTGGVLFKQPSAKLMQSASSYA